MRKHTKIFSINSNNKHSPLSPSSTFFHISISVVNEYTPTITMSDTDIKHEVWGRINSHVIPTRRSERGKGERKENGDMSADLEGYKIT